MSTVWHAGDTTPPLAGSTGVDLTTATAVTVHLRTPGGALLSRPAVLAAGATGAWSMPWQVGDLTPGVFDYEVEVTWADALVQTFPYGGVRVKPQLDGSGPPFTAPLSVVDNGDGTSTISWS